MSNIKVLGIDLAKNIFQLHGANAKGKCVVKKRLSREKLIEFMSNLSPCMVGIESCMGAHYWARLFKSMGHTVKMMAPQFVKPFVKSNKNDRNDAAGIAEAVVRPEMKFVPIKTLEQQDILLLHRARELAIKRRSSQANQIRGLLADYGIILAKGIRHVSKLLEVLEENKAKITPKAEKVFKQLYKQFQQYDEEVSAYEKEITQEVKQNALCQEVMKVPGIGPMTASAVVSSVGNASVFRRGREMAAWLGLVPKQRSSGNKTRLLGISKRGNHYLRKLLVQGARSVVTLCEKKTDGLHLWVADKKRRLGFNKAAVALANKNARMIWAIMATGECYRG